jgi:ribosomal protein L40E
VKLLLGALGVAEVAYGFLVGPALFLRLAQSARTQRAGFNPALASFVFIVCPTAVRIHRAARSRTNTKFLHVRAPTRDGPARRAHTSSGLSSEIEASHAGDFAARVCRLCAPPSALSATGCRKKHHRPATAAQIIKPF